MQQPPLPPPSHSLCSLHPAAAAPSQIVKGPVTKYFPLNCRRIGFSHSSPNLKTLAQYVQELKDDVPTVFVVGGFAHGKIDAPWVDEEVAVSQYQLSAAYCLCRITNAMEQKWGIV